MNGRAEVLIIDMCNLYSISTDQEAIGALFRMINRYVVNLPPMPGVFPTTLRQSCVMLTPSARWC
jgi:hypothetical protein